RVRRDTKRLQVAVDVLRNVRVRHDCVNAWQCLRLARVEASDRSVMMGRPQRLRPEGAADPDVVDVLRLPGDVGDAVVARKSCADGLHAGLPGINTSASSGSKLGSTCSEWTSPRTTASTARTILTQPVQRQTWPDNASSTSSRFALGSRSRRAVAANTKPDVQKPHCAA